MTNTTEKKMTQRDYYNTLLAIESVQAVPGLVDFINSRLAQLDKKSATKSTGERKPTAKQLANEVLKSAMLDNMEAEALYTTTDMVKNFDCFDDTITSQKVNALLRQMVAAGTVERVEDGHKVHFRKVA